MPDTVPTDTAPAALNPAVVAWTGPHGLPVFSAVKDADFAPAFDRLLPAHAAEIAAIADNPAPPTFANTITALELAGEGLSRASALFWSRAGTDTNPTLQALERDLAPRMSRHYSAISMNAALFARVDDLWTRRESLGLTPEETRVLERHWKGFVRAGAKLARPEQERLAAIDERLAALRARFGQNLLADEEAFVLLLDEADLAGVPATLRDAMAAEAKSRGADGRYALSLSRSLVEPFLSYADRRDLREQVLTAFLARGGNPGERDNRPVIKEMLALRFEAANLLGHPHHAARMLDDTMAKTPEAVTGLLRQVWDRAVARARDDEAALQALVQEEGRNHPIQPFDWRYYARKRRSRAFAFSDDAVKPYLSLDNMIAATFAVAERLFGIQAVEMPTGHGYHPDVRVFEIRDADGSLKALFLGDYFARPTKRSGAWMSGFQSQHKLAIDTGTGQIPIIINVCNFAKPAEGRPALLSFDDARTLFHEFGHALHGILSDVTYPSVSGTSVPRDFVELPSQLYEHWMTVPVVLKAFARHHATGEPMPQDLIDKVLAAGPTDAAFAAVEFTASALVDMAFHTRGPVDDPMAVEAEVLAEIGMPSSIAMRHRSPQFGHIFAGGYSAGYYSYTWSEVLDADAFEAFRETGDPFDPAVAERLRRHIYAVGGAVDPEETYRAFRGRMPTVDAMLVKKGLMDAA
ncbi:M3 family metallopeptidase [Mongoliimonas terrestris]|uniref:M3 family metallopeptidase n=1 Tax=Mongoliimonas terrestris TaxID=1709001 RepID=UPI0009496C15|nr:M3 family metallopeptidase [Mongoliimonas terrestris]